MSFVPEFNNKFGRARAEAGDWVWAASESRAMKATNVGRVEQVMDEILKVKFLAGGKGDIQSWDLVPLSETEVAEIFKVAAANIKDRLGRPVDGAK
jgi:hypothetical protein